MKNPLNVVLLITDGHGHHTGDLDWGTEEFRNLRTRMERLELGRRGFVKFNNVMAPAVSTIMSIESILSGLLAAKTHKMHWREWPEWDRLDYPQLSDFMEKKGYQVNGFSYLLNSENWMPGIRCYKPELYRDFPSQKRDTHSHHAVMAALRHYFSHAVQRGTPQFLIVHSIFLFDIWEEIMDLLRQNGVMDENTLFAFTADHYFPKNFGRQWLLGERDRSSIFHHTDLTEYNSRVFLQLKYPGMPAVPEIGAVVAGYDIAPTILDVLGVRSEWPGVFDGESLLPLLRGEALPRRFLRSDNVYPYQIGEKQGRISSIRSGSYKYVFRPDPASSYIAYRMHEPWGSVLAREEFYNVEDDPEEQKSMVESDDAEAKRALADCRRFFCRTTAEILRFHSAGLRQFAERHRLAEVLLPGKPLGRILCVQTCPPEVFFTIVFALVDLLPTAEIDLLVRDLSELPVPEKCRVVRGSASTANGLEALLAQVGVSSAADYDCVLVTSNLPLGDYASVYDRRAHPVGEFAAACKAIERSGARRCLALCLDFSLASVGKARQSWSAALRSGCRKSAVAPLRFLLERFKPSLQKWVRQVEGAGPKIQPLLSERIIRQK